MNNTNKVAWFVFAFLAIGVGFYPLIYVFSEGAVGIQLSKSKELLVDTLWNIGFYGHIIFGGLALMSGWVQFSKRIRNANLKRHRNLGKFYIIVVAISGLCGLYIAFYATGGFIAKSGFVSLALVWLFFTSQAYLAARKGDIEKHQAFMIYSYAACFGAVTLRIWLPLLTIAFGSFLPAYRIVAWLAWVPNIIFAYFWVRKRGLQLG